MKLERLKKTKEEKLQSRGGDFAHREEERV